MFGIPFSILFFLFSEYWCLFFCHIDRFSEKKIIINKPFEGILPQLRRFGQSAFWRVL